MNHIKTTLKLFAILMLLVGIINPFAITALAQLFFPKKQGGAFYMSQAAISQVQPLSGSLRPSAT